MLWSHGDMQSSHVVSEKKSLSYSRTMEILSCRLQVKDRLADPGLLSQKENLC